MDIQFLSENSYSIVEYVTKYIAEQETSDIDAYSDTSSNTAIQKAMKFGFWYLRSRDVSIHEVVDRMLHHAGHL